MTTSPQKARKRITQRLHENVSPEHHRIFIAGGQHHVPPPKRLKRHHRRVNRHDDREGVAEEIEEVDVRHRRGIVPRYATYA